MSPQIRSNSITAVLLASVGVLLACGSGSPEASALDSGDEVSSPGASAASEAPVIADADPCSLLSVEELQSALPHLRGPGHPDPTNHQCVYSGAFVQLRPVSRPDLETEHELFGLEPRPIDVPGADWAVVRLDRGDGAAMTIVQALPEELVGDAGKAPAAGEAPKVHDVIAVGRSGTVSLMPTGDHHPALESADYEALVELLRLAYGRL